MMLRAESEKQHISYVFSKLPQSLRGYRAASDISDQDITCGPSRNLAYRKKTKPGKGLRWLVDFRERTDLLINSS